MQTCKVETVQNPWDGNGQRVSIKQEKVAWKCTIVTKYTFTKMHKLSNILFIYFVVVYEKNAF